MNIKWDADKYALYREGRWYANKYLLKSEHAFAAIGLTLRNWCRCPLKRYFDLMN